MFKKIAQWIRIRQERRLREKVIMKWDFKHLDNPLIMKIADNTVKFILTGELPPPDSDNLG